MCLINRINSPDDGHMAAQNMYRIQINIHEKELCVKLVIYKHYTEMLHGQQNIKFSMFYSCSLHYRTLGTEINSVIGSKASCKQMGH